MTVTGVPAMADEDLEHDGNDTMAEFVFAAAFMLHV